MSDFWITNEGKVLLLSEMTDAHIAYAYKYFEPRLAQTHKNSNRHKAIKERLVMLDKESIRRQVQRSIEGE